MGRVGTFLLRLIQLICTAIVLGLSICAVRWQYRNSVPATNAFATFAGAFGCLDSLLGLMASVIGALAGLFMFFIDVLASIFLLAGGIAFAVGLHGSDCGDPDSSETWFNRLLNGGCTWAANEQVWDCSFWANSDLVKRCHMAKTNMAFLFISAILSFGVAIMSLMVMRSKRRTASTSS